MLKNIGFDETGYTGCNLLDQNQKFFLMSSVHFTDGHAKELATYLRGRGVEAKYDTLKRKQTGRKKIINFFKENEITSDNIKVNIIHKKFMLVCKIVDILVENSLHEDGLNLYNHKACLALSNLIYTCGPSLFGINNLDKLLYKFQKMLLNNTQEATSSFFEFARYLYHNFEKNKQNSIMELILISEQFIEDILRHNNKQSVDPLIPSVFAHASEWTRCLQSDFIAFHDTSTRLSDIRNSFLMFSDKGIKEEIIGYNRGMIIPFKVDDFISIDSKENNLVQIADVTAGATSYFVRCMTGHNELYEDFFNQLKDTNILDLVVHTIWPSDQVTPEELGTLEDLGYNPADYITEKVLLRSKK